MVAAGLAARLRRAAFHDDGRPLPPVHQVYTPRARRHTGRR
jgi:hypothetical protein